MNSTSRIVVAWSAESLEFAEINQADTALLERREPAAVTFDGLELHVTTLDLVNPEFSLLDVPFFREVSS